MNFCINNMVLNNIVIELPFTAEFIKQGFYFEIQKYYPNSWVKL